MKKVFKGLIVATMFATILPLTASCGGSTQKPDFEMPAEGFDTSKEVTIKFYHTMGQNLQEVLNLYLEDFKALYPNINVVHNAVGSYDDVRDQLVTEISSGQNDADLAYCYPDHVAKYLKAGSVVTLDKLIDDPTYGYTTEQKNDFVKAFYDEGKSFGDGKMYCLPFSKSSEVLYYDKTFFTENNLSVPTTWEEMETACRAIKAIDPESIPLGYDSASNWFITMCEQYGSTYTSLEEPHYTFNNDTNKAFVKKFKKWFDDGLVTTKGLYGSYTSGLYTSTGTTRCYMCIGSSAGATYQTSDRFETGITSIPQVDKEHHGAVISQGPDITIFRNEDPQKVLASWLLLKFLTTTPEFQAQFSMISGYTPVINSTNELKTYKDFLDKADGNKNIAALSTKVCVEQSNIYLTTPAFEGSSNARDAVGEMLEKIFGTVTNDVDTLIDNSFKATINDLEY